MSLKFTPPKDVGRFALFIDYGNERGFFKTYDRLASAKGAYHSRNRYGRNAAKILESVAGEWFVLYTIPMQTEYKDLPWVKNVERGGWSNRYTSPRAVGMTREEYADWRVKVEHEKLGLAEYSSK